MATNYNVKINLKTDNKDFNKGFTQAENRLKKHAASVSKLGNSYTDLSKAQKNSVSLAREAALRFGKNSKQFKTAAANAKKARNAILEVDAAMKKAGLTAKRNQGLLDGVFGVAMRRVVPLMLIGGATKLFGNAVRKLSTFEQKMSQVQAVTGSNAETMAKFNEAAIRISSVTPKTATDVANLQVEMSKLGFTSDETLVSMRSIIDLSVAGFHDLGETAGLVASSLNAFQLSAGYARDVADTFAHGVSTSALTLEKLAVGLPNVAKGAKEFGLSIQKTTGLLGILADNGIDASKMGTDLRMILTKLSQEGLTLDEGLLKIENSTNKINTAQEIFGQRAFLSAIALADQREEILELDEAYSKISGTAEDMGGIMQDNVLGAMLRVTSAWEALVQRMQEGGGIIKSVLNGLALTLNDINIALGGLDQNRIDAIAKSLRKLGEDAIGDWDDERFGIQRFIDDFLELEKLKIESDLNFYLEEGDAPEETVRKLKEQLEAIKTVIAEYKAKLDIPITISGGAMSSGIGGGGSDKKKAPLFPYTADLMTDIKAKQDEIAQASSVLANSWGTDYEAMARHVEKLKIELGLMTGEIKDAEPTADKLQENLRKTFGTYVEDGWEAIDVLDSFGNSLNDTAKKAEEMREALQKIADFRADFASALGDELIAGLDTMFSYVGESLAKGTFTWESLGNTMLAQLGGTLKNLGILLVAYGITIDAFKKAFANPYVAIGAGLSAIAIGSAFTVLASKNPTGGSSSGGGGYKTPSFSANSGYSRYAAQQSGHRAFGESSRSNVEFKIKGTDLVGVLKRNNVKTNNIK